MARAIILFARLLTGMQARWNGRAAAAVQRICFANHSSHGDFVLIWGLPAAGPAAAGLTADGEAADLLEQIGLAPFHQQGCVPRRWLIDRTRSDFRAATRWHFDGQARARGRLADPVSRRHAQYHRRAAPALQERHLPPGVRLPGRGARAGVDR
ncbi:hypothetical protein ACU4GD_01005 [Cupriavidus basilensis]